MKRKGLQQKNERRVAAALRMAMVVLLLALQIVAIVFASHFLRENLGVIYAVMQIIGLLVALYIYNRPGGDNYKLAWIVLILLSPAVGFILYLLWGTHWQKHRFAKRHTVIFEENEETKQRQRETQEALAAQYPQWKPLSRYLLRHGFAPYGNTEVTYFAEGAAFLQDLAEIAAKAEKFIFLEYFILAEGKVFDLFAKVLCEKARNGVEVKIIFDDFGNIRRFSAKTLDMLRENGVEVCVFNPVVRYVNRMYFNYRDHRKIAVIDGEYAYTGGVNIADEYANIITRFGYWKDSGVRLHGEGAWGFCHEFMEFWVLSGGEPIERVDAYRPQTHIEGSGFCQPFTDGPFRYPSKPAEDTFMQFIANAKRKIYITTPYFVPDERTMRALCVAGDGDVDVRLFLPGKPDHWTTDCIAESHFAKLMEHGVKIYRYTPGFLHEKTVLADDEVAFVGSINIDYRSFDLHFECGTVLYGTDAIASLQKDLEQIMAESKLLDEEDIRKRKWYRRMLAPFLRLFAIWL